MAANAGKYRVNTVTDTGSVSRDSSQLRNQTAWNRHTTFDNSNIISEEIDKESEDDSDFGDDYEVVDNIEIPGRRNP